MKKTAKPRHLPISIVDKDGKATPGEIKMSLKTQNTLAGNFTLQFLAYSSFVASVILAVAAALLTDWYANEDFCYPFGRTFDKLQTFRRCGQVMPAIIVFMFAFAALLIVLGVGFLQIKSAVFTV